MAKFTRIIPVGQFSSPVEEEPFDIDLNILSAGITRQSAMINNYEDYPAALISVRIKSNIAPEAKRTYNVYLIRDMGNVADDNAGDDDGLLNLLNSPLLGTIIVTNTATKNFYGIFYTGVKDLGPLGHKWGIAIKNDTDQGLASSGHYAGYIYMVPGTDE